MYVHIYIYTYVCHWIPSIQMNPDYSFEHCVPSDLTL